MLCLCRNIADVLESERRKKKLRSVELLIYLWVFDRIISISDIILVCFNYTAL